MKRIELKIVSIVFLTMFLFMSTQIPVFAVDTDTTVKIPVEQVFNSKNTDASDEFMYALITDQSDAPMPDGSRNQQYVWNMKGNIAAEITMNIRNAGQYHYKICQITEKKENYSYDERNYDITVEAFYNADNQLKVITVVENQDGEKVSEISFRNSYTWQGKDKSGPSLISEISKSNSVKTGYDSPIIGYFTLLLGSLICLIVMIRETQRKKKGDAQNEAQ